MYLRSSSLARYTRLRFLSSLIPLSDTEFSLMLCLSEHFALCLNTPRVQHSRVQHLLKVKKVKCCLLTADSVVMEETHYNSDLEKLK